MSWSARSRRPGSSRPEPRSRVRGGRRHLASAGGLTPPRGRGGHQPRVDRQGTARVVVADSSKLGKLAFARICPLADVDELITDACADASRAGAPRGDRRDGGLGLERSGGGRVSLPTPARPPPPGSLPRVPAAARPAPARPGRGRRRCRSRRGAKMGASLSLLTAAMSSCLRDAHGVLHLARDADRQVHVGRGLGARQADDAVLGQPAEVGEALGAGKLGAQRGGEAFAERHVLALAQDRGPRRRCAARRPGRPTRPPWACARPGARPGPAAPAHGDDLAGRAAGLAGLEDLGHHGDHLDGRGHRLALHGGAAAGCSAPATSAPSSTASDVRVGHAAGAEALRQATGAVSRPRRVEPSSTTLAPACSTTWASAWATTAVSRPLERRVGAGIHGRGAVAGEDGRRGGRVGPERRRAHSRGRAAAQGRAAAPKSSSAVSVCSQ